MKIATKIAKYSLIAVFLLAFPIQILWAAIFWNNDGLFEFHWLISGLAIAILWCIFLPAILWAIFKEDFIIF